jgi:hypothetical protein
MPISLIAIINNSIVKSKFLLITFMISWKNGIKVIIPI